MVSHFDINELMDKRSSSKIIVSRYLNGENMSKEKLGNLIASMQSSGGDVIKLLVEVDYITDLAPIFQLLTSCQVLVTVYSL